MLEPWMLAAAAATMVAATGALAWSRRTVAPTVPPAPTVAPPVSPVSATRSSLEPAIGEVLGGYRLKKRLDQGGTAVVYEAVSVSNPKAPAVAIKVLVLPDVQYAGHFNQRFEREVQILRQLDHPNIVRFHSGGESNGRLFLVEELAVGGTLRKRIAAEGMSPSPFLTLFIPMVEAVAYAHSQGVVHRDLKPENILLTGGPIDTIKITDFGLARSEYLEGFTTTGTTLGTPVYMSPEQVTGRGGEWSLADQYSLGIIGYEMLVGTAPFLGPITELIEKHLYEAPMPVSQMMSHPIPPELETILMRMLVKRPQERFPDLGQVAEQLRACQAGLVA